MILGRVEDEIVVKFIKNNVLLCFCVNNKVLLSSGNVVRFCNKYKPAQEVHLNLLQRSFRMTAARVTATLRTSHC